MEQIANCRWLRALFAFVLSFALMVPSALLSAAPRLAWASGETVTVTVDGLAANAIPALTEGKDFAYGQPVNADPAQYTDTSGNRPLGDLVEQKAKQGLEIKWTDADTGKDFSWSETKITKSTKVKGTWVAKQCQVTLVYDDDGATPNKTVKVEWGKAYTSAAKAPADPVREGWAFDGWKTVDGKAFDFAADKVTENTVVKASWHVSDTKKVTPKDPTSDVPTEISGNCYIGATWDVHPAHFALTWFDGYLEGASGEGLCASPSAAQPSNTFATYTATLKGIDVASGTVTYDVYITPPDATDGVTRNAYGLVGYQYVSATVSIQRNFGGYLEIDKSSANAGITDGNSCYSLEGAEYSVYASDGSLSAVLVTDANGHAKSDLLPAGDYTVKETKAPKGYALDSEIHSASITAGATVGLSLTDEPQNDPVAILLGKYDSETTYKGEGNLPKGSASLAGAEFSVEYYDGYYDTVEQAEASGDPVRSWILKTDEDGFCYLAADYLIKGDNFYTNSDGNITLPLGTLIIKETKAPEGYNLPQPFGLDQSWLRTITADGSAELVRTYNAPTVAEPIERGDVSFKKVDEDQQALANVPFKITSSTGESHVIVTDANGYASTKASWNKHSENTNGNDWYLDQADGNVLGGIVNAITGKSLDASAGIWFTGKHDGQEGSDTPNDSRGALPYDTYTLEELPCAANAGHTLVTKTFTVYKDSTFNNEANVDLGTVTDWNLSIGTTATDKATGGKDVTDDPEAVVTDKVHCKGLRTGAEYTVTGTLMDKATGKALTGADGKTITASKTFTATDTEQDVDIDFAIGGADLSDGQALVVFEKLYSDGNEIANHEKIDDEGQTVTVKQPKIGTTATSGQAGHEGSKNVVTDTEAVVVDQVAYSNLVTGKEYTVSGTLMDKETGKAIENADGSKVTASKTFTPEGTYGTVEVTFSFDASALSGHEVVAFESLSRTGTEVASHADIDDEGQTVTVTPPTGSTQAHGTEGEKTVPAAETVTVVDTVSYEGLVTGKEYTVTGTLMVKETGEALLDADGNPVTATTAFTPLDTYGTVEVTFSFDASLLGGKELVAFEQVQRDGKTVFAHEDITDEGQTVLIGQPKIGTQLLDGLDSDSEVIADAQSSVVDVVSYENLVKGGKYTLYTMLMDTETGLPFVVGDGSYSADAAELVAFGKEVMAALNLADADTAADGSSASVPKSLSPDSAKAIDADALAKAFADHAELAAHLAYGSTEFTAEKSSGTQEVAVSLDSSKLAGKKTTCYEVLATGGKVPAVHADLSDEDQQVTFDAPEIGTELTDASDGDHEILPGTVTLTDTVSYENLVPGKEYVLKAKLMDKSTGKTLIAGDKEVTSQTSFVPNAQSGTVEVTFEFDASALSAGSQLVAFEDCYKDEILVATHSDIDDEAQTVTVTEIPAGSFFAKTGADAAIAYVVALVLAAAAAAAGVLAIRRRMQAE